jgi:hypothetical protein
MDPRTAALVAECNRQAESCLYSSTALYFWLREARCWRVLFVTAPIVLAGIATWSVLDKPESACLRWLTAVAALLAGLFPAIYEALKLNVHIAGLVKEAAEFKNLQDRFRQAANVAALGPFEAFEAEFQRLMAGDYSFLADENRAGC